MSMASRNVRDLLTSFSPSLDFFAISSGDGRIKIWDAIRGQLQTEFADIASSDTSSLLSEPRKGHLSLDYTCMKWVQLASKKKKKSRSSLLILGTGGGDVFALDVSAGQLKWKVSDCSAGGVNAISSSAHSSCVYTAGADGMVCQIDISTGNALGKFRASTKAISNMTVSADGKTLATAAGQLKTFSCSDNKKIQKFTGHPVAVRCMIFSEDGQYIISSGVGEKHVAIWNVGDAKMKSAVCLLSVEHPAIFLDSKSLDSKDKDGPLYVLATSEIGICYFWYGSNIAKLRSCRPTKISMSIESSLPRTSQDFPIFAAKLQAIPEPSFGQVFVAYGSLVKPSFEKVLVQNGIDIKLDRSQGGLLLQRKSLGEAHKGSTTQIRVTALDRANAEDAILPLPKLHAESKKRKHGMTQQAVDNRDAMPDPIMSTIKSQPAVNKVNLQSLEDVNSICIEDRLRKLGIIRKNDDPRGESLHTDPIDADLDMYSGGKIFADAYLPAKKVNSQIASLSPADASKFLEILLSAWKCRSTSLNYMFPWVYSILVKHGRYIVSQESSVQMLDDVERLTRSKSKVVGPLLKLSGRLRLIIAQFDKANIQTPTDEHEGGGKTVDEDVDDDESVDEEDEIYEMVYGEDEEESNSDDDDNK